MHTAAISRDRLRPDVPRAGQRSVRLCKSDPVQL